MISVYRSSLQDSRASVLISKLLNDFQNLLYVYYCGSGLNQILQMLRSIWTVKLLLKYLFRSDITILPAHS